MVTRKRNQRRLPRSRLNPEPKSKVSLKTKRKEKGLQGKEIFYDI